MKAALAVASTSKLRNGSQAQKPMLLPKEKLIGLDPTFLEILTRIANKLPFSLVITSGKRTLDGNSVLNGAVPDSAHLAGLAVDVAVDGNDFTLYAVMNAAMSEGVTRFGIYLNAQFKPNHLHFDVDKTKPQNVIFLKQELN